MVIRRPRGEPFILLEAAEEEPTNVDRGSAALAEFLKKSVSALARPAARAGLSFLPMWGQMVARDAVFPFFWSSSIS